MIMTELTMLLTLPSPIYPAASKDQDTNGSGVLCLVKKGIKFHPIIEEEIGKQIQIWAFIIVFIFEKFVNWRGQSFQVYIVNCAYEWSTSSQIVQDYFTSEVDILW